MDHRLGESPDSPESKQEHWHLTTFIIKGLQWGVYDQTEFISIDKFTFSLSFPNSKGHLLPLSSRMKEEMMRSHSAFLVSIRIRTRSKRLSKGLARATFTDSGSLGLYCPLGLVAARMVVRVFSLHTILKGGEKGRFRQGSSCYHAYQQKYGVYIKFMYRSILKIDLGSTQFVLSVPDV